AAVGLRLTAAARPREGQRVEPVTLFERLGHQQGLFLSVQVDLVLHLGLFALELSLSDAAAILTGQLGRSAAGLGVLDARLITHRRENLRNHFVLGRRTLFFLHLDRW